MFIQPAFAVVDVLPVVLRIGFVLACLAGPILWGILVNWLFDVWQNRQADQFQSKEEDHVFPDYQI